MKTCSILTILITAMLASLAACSTATESNSEVHQDGVTNGPDKLRFFTYESLDTNQCNMPLDNVPIDIVPEGDGPKADDVCNHVKQVLHGTCTTDDDGYTYELAWSDESIKMVWIGSRFFGKYGFRIYSNLEGNAYLTKNVISLFPNPATYTINVSGDSYRHMGSFEGFSYIKNPTHVPLGQTHWLIIDNDKSFSVSSLFTLSTDYYGFPLKVHDESRIGDVIIIDNDKTKCLPKRK